MGRRDRARVWGGEWALPSVKPSDIAPGCGVHAFISSSFTAVRISLVFFLALTVLCAQSQTRVFGTLASEVKHLKYKATSSELAARS